MRVLLTGGAGYIGTHTAVELLNNDHEVIVVDNLANSSVEAIRRVERLTNKQIQFHETDLLDYSSLEKVLQIEKPDAVIH
ncbi:MAG: SDR family NAD(P)-dependent oxidoreductase, partial [Pseudomonadales bacterium]